MSFKYQNNWQMFENCGARFLSEAFLNLRLDISKDNNLFHEPKQKSIERSNTGGTQFFSQLDYHLFEMCWLLQYLLVDFHVCRKYQIDLSQSTSTIERESCRRVDNITSAGSRNFTWKTDERLWVFGWMIPKNDRFQKHGSWDYWVL